MSALLERVERALRELNEDEREVALRRMERIADRLRIGRERYGPYVATSDERDWGKEIREELDDACVYDTMAELNAEKKRC